MGEHADWLRVRGIGRERFAGYIADYLGTLGYTVERSESAEPMETRVSARLARPNPSIPPSAAELSFSLYPTSGGAGLVWVAPAIVAPADRGRMDRFVREIATHLERTIATGSHATAKVIRPSEPRLPWEPAPAPAAGKAVRPPDSAPPSDGPSRAGPSWS